MQQAANTAAAKLKGTEEVVRKSGGALAPPAVVVHPRQAALTGAATSEGTKQTQTPTDTAPAAAVAVQQAATLDGTEQVQKPSGTAPAAAAVDLLQAANTAAAKSNGQKKAAKPTGRAIAPAMSAQKRAGDPAAKQGSSARQQTSQSSLPPATRSPAQAVPSGSQFRYDRMFPAQTKGSHSDSSNALPRRAEPKASR